MAIRIIKSVMTPFPYSVGRDSTIEQARSMMRAHDINHLPVKDRDRLVGVVSAADIRRSMRSGSPEQTVGAMMQTDPYVVELGTALADVLLHMAANHIECVLVTKAGRLAGIFTTVDACRAYGEDLRSRQGGGDAA